MQIGGMSQAAIFIIVTDVNVRRGESESSGKNSFLLINSSHTGQWSTTSYKVVEQNVMTTHQLNGEFGSENRMMIYSWSFADYCIFNGILTVYRQSYLRFKDAYLQPLPSAAENKSMRLVQGEIPLDFKKREILHLVCEYFRKRMLEFCRCVFIVTMASYFLLMAIIGINSSFYGRT